MKPIYFLAVIPLILLIGGGFFVKKTFFPSPSIAVATPTPEPVVEQLPLESQPQASLQFSADGHYVTIKLANVQAAQLEYNLIYDATVKKNQIQTGVSGSARLNGQTTYSQKQLLGSESSGHFTFHDNISNATLELVLRNESGYSVFSATYPFTVSPGKSVSLTASE
jgi:hypothetical protein